MKQIVGVAAMALGLQVLLPVGPSAQRDVRPRPIQSFGTALPPESASAGVRRFSFIAYGDTRGQADGRALQTEHGRIVDSMLDAIKARASTDFPVRFVVQSGDAVTTGSETEQWDVSFTPIIERLVRGGRVPYFLSVGNHDVTLHATDDPRRAAGLANTLAVLANLMPPSGSPRRLDGYPTFAFGYGNLLVMAIDSNIADDATQIAWATEQLDGLDRSRYRHVIAVFHHPPFSSGPHGGPTLESQTASIRRHYMPLFRRHHVRMTIAGHEHFFEHWVERYVDQAGPHRADHIVTGGGGAPTYAYRGEPDLDDYIAAAAPLKIGLDHLVKPGPTSGDNPHHFVVVQVDGDQLSLEVVTTSPRGFRPYGRPRVDLVDRKS